MKLKVTKKHGNVIITDSEIIKTIHEHILMVPGVTLTSHDNVFNKIIKKPAIKVYLVRENAIGVVLDIKLDQHIRVIDATKGIQENVKYVVEKKYGINVDHIDVNIKGIKNEN